MIKPAFSHKCTIIINAARVVASTARVVAGSKQDGVAVKSNRAHFVTQLSAHPGAASQQAHVSPRIEWQTNRRQYMQHMPQGLACPAALVIVPSKSAPLLDAAAVGADGVAQLLLVLYWYRSAASEACRAHNGGC
jgi:poly(3-hydroxybutyrate) depolymerase